ncbi:MAG: DUF4956 domain-containing protein [Streptococcus salivarius]|nr:DUF4956 domain-containing protein [Streptococcus salivarius]
MSNLFNSIFNDATATASPLQLMLALLVSLVLGLALTWTYKYRTLYTREFVISLTLLPCLMTLVIFLVNGSLGTSIAVAGTGTGYLLLAVLFTIFLLAVWLLLENRQSRTDNQRRRLLTINVPYQDLIDQKITKALLNFTSECDLISLNTTGGGEIMQLVYEVDLNPQVDDFQLTNHLISSIKNCDLALTKKAKKKKNL